MSDCNKLAAWMIEHGFATGHGDTTDDLLVELGPQVERLRAEVAAMKECDKTRLETISQLRDELDAALGKESTNG